jgi:hypothetical protein
VERVERQRAGVSWSCLVVGRSMVAVFVCDLVTGRDTDGGNGWGCLLVGLLLDLFVDEMV